MKFLSRIGCTLLALVLCLALCVPAMAAETGSLTLHYVLKDYTFQLYHVANYAADGSFKLLPAYERLPVDWSDMERQDWYDLAANLDTMVIVEGIAPDRTAVTDENGAAYFGDLSYGLWLIAGGTAIEGKIIYTTQPLLVAIPGATSAGTVEADRDLVISKYTEEKVPEKQDISVVKKWNDGNAADRPTSIKVGLYKNGDLVDTVELSKDNNWRHTWKDLEVGPKWTVGEIDTPKGYTCKESVSGNTHIFTNTKPGTPEKPPEKLPQTGLDWTPVAILVPLGLLCLIIGAVIRRRSEEEA